MKPFKPDSKVSNYAQKLKFYTRNMKADYIRNLTLEIACEGWAEMKPELNKIAIEFNSTLPKHIKPIELLV